jgi:folate-binding protein YgfZ
MSESISSWPGFLASQGASPAEPGSPDLFTFPAPAQLESGFVCALSHLGVISASGEDAASFLHNQLTNDVLGLDGALAHLAGYCSPKGRLLATMLIWKDGGAIRLALPRELLPAILKRLRMFVLRSKVTLEDSSEQIILTGLAAPILALPGLPLAPLRQSASEGGAAIRLPDAAGLQRCLWAGAAGPAEQLWQRAALQPAPAYLWRWTDIMAGQPQVLDATREQFVPQMINYELIGGVNFRKGCYPGQEVVARSQYLGKLKRRMLLAHADTGATAGEEVFSDTDPGQHCGMIVNAERGPDGRFACRVEIKMELAGSGIRLRAADGVPLSFAELPYPLAEPA